MTHRIFIDGAAGTTGLEIADRLKDRSEFELIALDDAQRKDTAARREALNEADVAILCLPDDAAREAVELVDPANGTRIIDASSAHRTAEGWCYGFPELVGRERVANARRVSNPGCYPTGFLALMAPLTAPIQAIKSPTNPEPLGDPTTILPVDWAYCVNAVSGYSGGGRSLIDRFETDGSIAFRSYGLRLGHKHLDEMQKYARLKWPPVFSPSVVSTFRGMIVDIPISLEAMGLQHPMALQSELEMWYDFDHEIVRVHPMLETPVELVLENDAQPWDGIDLYVCADDGVTRNSSKQVRLVAKLDNLGKGASGAAVQNLNLMCGLPATAGLRLTPA